jgi:hypothetical protein
MGLAPRSKAQHARRPRTQSANGIDHGFMNSVLGNFKCIGRLTQMAIGSGVYICTVRHLVRARTNRLARDNVENSIIYVTASLASRHRPRAAALA